MATFEATMRVTHLETWSVEAVSIHEAREKLNALHEDVETDETGGETIDWEISAIKAQEGE